MENLIQLIDLEIVSGDKLESRISTLETYLEDENYLRADVISALLFEQLLDELTEGDYETELQSWMLNDLLTWLGFERQWQPAE